MASDAAEFITRVELTVTWGGEAIEEKTDFQSLNFLGKILRFSHCPSCKTTKPLAMENYFIANSRRTNNFN